MKFIFALLLACGLANVLVQGGPTVKREAGRQEAILISPEDAVGFAGPMDDDFYRGGFNPVKRAANPARRKKGTKRKALIKGGSQGVASAATNWALGHIGSWFG